MKFKVRATVVYEWEEDSENWQGDEPLETAEAILAAANEYAAEDPAYILDCEPTTISKIEAI